MSRISACRGRSAIAAAAIIATAMIGAALLLSVDHDPVSVGQPVAEDLRSRVVAFVNHIPGPGSGGYDRPTADEANRMASAVRAVRAGRLQEASDLAMPLDYTVQRFTDTATGRSLVVLDERQNADGSWPHGWGLYVHSPGSPSPVIIEVAHPLDDIDTQIIGVELFRLANASDLFVAGASRYANADGSSDMTHASGSVFDAIHRSALHTGEIIVQPHGFEEQRHDDYGDIVVTSGSFPPQPLSVSLAEELRAQGYGVCLYDGDHCQALGATTNVQGVSTRAAGAQFLHVELSEDIRLDPANRDRVVAVIAKLLR